MINKHFVQSKQIAKHQSGVVLVVSLIILLALTLIGVTSSNVTGLEVKMAANSKDQNIAFQAAEAALRAAEDSLGDNKPVLHPNYVQGTDGYYTLLNDDGNPDANPPTYATLKTPIQDPPFYTTVDWYGTKVHAYTSDAAKTLAGVSKPPVYIIEELSSVGSDSEDTGPNEPGTVGYTSPGEVITFRITAHGWGSNNSVATVQSVVKVPYKNKK